MGKDPAGAWQFAQTLPTDTPQATMMHDLMERWGHQDPAAAALLRLVANRFVHLEPLPKSFQSPAAPCDLPRVAADFHLLHRTTRTSPDQWNRVFHARKMNDSSGTKRFVSRRASRNVPGATLPRPTPADSEAAAPRRRGSRLQVHRPRSVRDQASSESAALGARSRRELVRSSRTQPTPRSRAGTFVRGSRAPRWRVVTWPPSRQLCYRPT